VSSGFKASHDLRSADCAERIGYAKIFKNCAKIIITATLTLAFISCGGGGSSSSSSANNNQNPPPPSAKSITPIYFGNKYVDLIPENPTKQKYDEKLFALINGNVYDADKNPIANVKVTILNQKEYGSALTNDQGFYIIPVEGGRKITIRLQKEGYLTIDRIIETKIQDFNIAQDITMLKLDEKATTIDLNSDQIQAHTSTTITDDRGSRSASIVFNGKTP
jgi:hypothetical protein